MYNILIVDDEKIERNGIRFLLKRMGIEFNITEASNGKEAFDYMQKVKDTKEVPDILLTDVKMPFMDGIELIKSAKEAGLNMKNIIFSGYNEFEYAKLAVKLGVVDYILKPVNPKEFETAITKVVNELDSENIERINESKKDNYIQEYLLYSLINGRNIESSDNFFMPVLDYNRMFLIEFNSDFFGKESVDFVSDVLLNINGLEGCRYLNLNQQQAVVMLNEQNKNQEYIFDIANRIHKVVFEKFTHNCYIAVSEKLDTYGNISEAMDYLEQLMENKFYYPEVYVYTGHKDEKDSQLVQIDDDTLMKQMKQDIKMKDIKALREHFDRLSKKYQNQSCFSHIYTKFIFSNLLKMFYESSANDNEEQFNKEIEKLYTSEDLKTIIDIINTHIDELEKCFEQNPATSHREIETVKQYIFTHYGEEIGVDQLAGMVYLTPSYLSALFKKETGQNLSKFIKQYRMEKAKDMLENTNKKIVTISNETGYVNVSYFCQSFREYFGISPQKFRDCGGEAYDEDK